MKFAMTTALAGTLALGLGFAGEALADIRIGATVSETGPASFLGDPEAKTLKLLVDEINAEAELQRRSLQELRMVLEPGLLKNKLALIGGPGGEERRAP